MGCDTTTSQPARKQYTHNKGKMCSNCKQAEATKSGRCTICYNYHNRTGSERPAYMYLKPPRTKQAKWCKNCGRMDLRSHSRCNACHQYFKAHGKERPRHLYKVDQERRCKNCKIPLATLGKKPSGQNRYKCGLCETCYSYKRRTGCHRPHHLWGDGPLGFCECGYPAVALVEDIPVCARHRV